MKSTYKLLGAFWDQMPCDNKELQIRETVPTENSFCVSLSDILSMKNREAIPALLGENEIRTAVVNIDFSPKTANGVLQTFYGKRLRQISAFLKQYFDKVCFVKEKE